MTTTINVNLFERIANMVSTSMSNTYDPNISTDVNTYYDSKSFVITDASPGQSGVAWDSQEPINLISSFYNLFDGRPETNTRILGGDVTPYVEFDAGAPIKLTGFKFKPKDLSPDESANMGGIPGYGYINPVTRLQGRLSLADDWVTFATLTVDTSPTTTDAIEKVMAFSATYRFFRFEFEHPPAIEGTTRYSPWISSMQLIKTNW